MEMGFVSKRQQPLPTIRKQPKTYNWSPTQGENPAPVGGLQLIIKQKCVLVQFALNLTAHS